MSGLFQFNSSFIEGLGLDSLARQIEDVTSLIEDEVRSALVKAAPDEDYEVYWDGDTINVALSEEQAQREFGQPGVTMRPVVRSAMARAVEQTRARMDIHV